MQWIGVQEIVYTADDGRTDRTTSFRRGRLFTVRSRRGLLRASGAEDPKSSRAPRSAWWCASLALRGEEQLSDMHQLLSLLQ